MLLIYIFRLIRKKNESYESGIIPFSSDAITILQHPFPRWYNLNLQPLAFQLPLILISYNHRLL